ncbi:MAG TPA: serine/threonine-protein kinase [Pilimelia sp.]|nr:serine/threonine-protein kinase [Pilimelia sp.]
MSLPARIGSYRVERLLGVGSFATVWLGFDPSLDARVAIKVLADNWSHDLRVRERFLDEGRLLWRLDHERLVRVHAVGELDDGRPYLVMAWAEGGSLRDRLAAGTPPVHTGLRLLREIAAGAAVLHENGIVHRDLTPGNILFRPCRPAAGPRPEAGPEPGWLDTEQVLIADLGLAKALAAASGLTARAGTPGYMAPEQDDPLAIVDTRADVYALGRLGCRLLGMPATGAGTDIKPRAGVHPKVVDVIRKATAYRPGDRFPDAGAFGAALDRATAVTGAVIRHRPAMVAAAALALLAVMAAVAADAVRMRPRGGPGTGQDTTRRITVTLPEGWRVAGSGWAGQRDAAGRLEPALVISPDPGRWPRDPAVPGAFVGLSESIAARTSPARYLGEHPHAECTASPLRISRQAGVAWVVAEFTACREGKPVIVEAAGTGPDGAGLVYVQIAPPAGRGPEFVDELLAGVHVRR